LTTRVLEFSWKLLTSMNSIEISSGSVISHL
jgi:hypothetical protein